MQFIAAESSNGAWTFHRGINVDFGHEYRGIPSLNRRAVRQVVFCGSTRIDQNADHTRLDLALLELAPATAATKPESVLAVDASGESASDGASIYTIGYPAIPQEGIYTPTLLEQLFQRTFGCKRLAPGKVLPSQRSGQAWTPRTTLPHWSATRGR